MWNKLVTLIRGARVAPSAQVSPFISFLEPKDGPVIPGEEEREVIYARDQPEYIPLRTIVSPDASRAVLSRWSPTLEQRRRIAAGQDIYLRLLTFGHPLQPIQMFLAEEGHVQESREEIQPQQMVSR